MLIALFYKLHQVSVKIDTQFHIKGKGRTFSADGGLIAIVVNEVPVPVYIIEYKPRAQDVTAWQSV